MFIPCRPQLVCTESSLILNPHRLLPGSGSGICYHNLFGSRYYFLNLFFQLAQRCLIGSYCNNKQIKTEHDTVASACFYLLAPRFCLLLLFLFFFFFPCAYVLMRKEEGARAESVETER